LLTYGHPEEKVDLLYNADVFLNFGPSKGNIIGLLRLKTRKKFLAGYAGGLGKANDILTLLRAAMSLVELKDLGFVIIGDGENLSVYEKYCQKNCLENIYFLGPKPREVALELLKETDICIQPLPHHQHFSHTLTSKTFDYHGLGKPMVFSGQGDTVNLLAESGGGLAVPPEDDKALAAAIRELLQDEKLRIRMGTAARKWFEEHISFDHARAIIKRAMNGSD
jgi:colanic acid biosynthesis glycosyl transferase WcaI